jgi:hypothetical protein
MKRLALAMVVAAVSTTSFAETYKTERPYVGIDYQLGSFEMANGTEAEPTAVRLRAGTELAPMLAVEAHVAAGAESDVLALPGVNYEVEMNALYSVFRSATNQAWRMCSTVYGSAGLYLCRHAGNRRAIRECFRPPAATRRELLLVGAPI